MKSAEERVKVLEIYSYCHRHSPAPLPPPPFPLSYTSSFFSSSSSSLSSPPSPSSLYALIPSLIAIFLHILITHIIAIHLHSLDNPLAISPLTEFMTLTLTSPSITTYTVCFLPQTYEASKSVDKHARSPTANACARKQSCFPRMSCHHIVTSFRCRANVASPQAGGHVCLFAPTVEREDLVSGERMAVQQTWQILA
ncbi:hypothetical protein PoB_003463500 [Plakobranchus ocellatus]|uniref:Uncharacterized protein n=1 Tax=Plakobranchus ocellatus TaxID=259542 RepID=A0AAV4AMK9_9GAST|nr:hypothetical protein PoB_003463500 [Plakobranchus ocellatus]